MNNQFDIIILVGKNDTDNIKENIENNKKNIIGYRNIYIISPLNINIEDCILINDDIFPFKINDISNLINNKSRANWYLQQLIKFYAVFVIPDILDRILTIDSDTYFMKPTTFIDETDKILLNYSVEFHIPYFNHMERLHPSLIKYNSKQSGITHHCLLDKKILEELFKLIEDYHNKKYWIAFLDCIDKDENLISGASEFEIYFNYSQIYHNDKIKIRYLNFNDIFDNKKEFSNEYDYFSKHKWFYN